jgi:hypothetical protein
LQKKRIRCNCRNKSEISLEEIEEFKLKINTEKKLVISFEETEEL